MWWVCSTGHSDPDKWAVLPVSHALCRTGKHLGYAEQRKSWTHTTFFGWMATAASTGQLRVGDAVALSHKH